MRRSFRSIPLALLLSLTFITVALADSNPVSYGERELSATIKAKVVDINYKTRELTLQTPSGGRTTLVAGEDIKNLDKVKKGDTVVADYTSSVEFVVNKDRKPSSLEETSTQSFNSIPGKSPAGIAQRQAKTSVTITAIDRKKKTITVKDAKGEKSTFNVQHPERLAGVNVGDIIDITIKEALALSVVK